MICLRWLIEIQFFFLFLWLHWGRFPSQRKLLISQGIEEFVHMYEERKLETSADVAALPSTKSKIVWRF